MKNLWEVWPHALSPQYCDYIVEKAMRHPSSEANIGLEGELSDINIRKSTIRWLDVQSQDSDIAETVMRFVRRSNRTNFGFDITTMNEIQFTEYTGAPTGGGKYDWHVDIFWENQMPFDRKLSVVIQLSHPNEYTGGEFEFFGIESPGESFKERGSVLVFPSVFNHRVLPVTSGKRLSLVTWIEGPKFR